MTDPHPTNNPTSTLDRSRSPSPSPSLRRSSSRSTSRVAPLPQFHTQRHSQPDITIPTHDYFVRGPPHPTREISNDEPAPISRDPSNDSTQTDSITHTIHHTPHTSQTDLIRNDIRRESWHVTSMDEHEPDTITSTTSPDSDNKQHQHTLTNDNLLIQIQSHDDDDTKKAMKSFKQPKSMGKIKSRAPFTSWLGGLFFFVAWGNSLGSLASNSWIEYAPEYKTLVRKDTEDFVLVAIAVFMGGMGVLALFARELGFFQHRPRIKMMAWILLFAFGILTTLTVELFIHTHPLSNTIHTYYPNITNDQLPNGNTFQWTLPEVDGIRFGPGFRFCITARNLFIAAVIALLSHELYAYYDREKFTRHATKAIHQHGIRRYQLTDYYRFVLGQELHTKMGIPTEKGRIRQSTATSANPHMINKNDPAITTLSAGRNFLVLHDAMKLPLNTDDIAIVRHAMWLYRDRISPTQSRLLIAIVAMYLTVSIGAAIYTQLEDWNIRVATQFCLVTITTIGYGSPAPQTWGGRAFIFIYFPIGFATIGYTIKILWEVVLKRVRTSVGHAREALHSDQAKRATSVAHHAIDGVRSFLITHLSHVRQRAVQVVSPRSHTANIQLSPRSSTTTTTAITPTPSTATTLKIREQQLAAQESGTRLALYIAICFVIVLALIAAKIFSNSEGWTYFEGLYFSFVTLTTIGYGDLVPQDPSTDFFFTWFVVLGIGSLAYMLTLIGEMFTQNIEKRLLKQEQKQYQQEQKLKIKELRKRQRDREREHALMKQMEESAAKPDPHHHHHRSTTSPVAHATPSSEQLTSHASAPNKPLKDAVHAAKILENHLQLLVKKHKKQKEMVLDLDHVTSLSTALSTFLTTSQPSPLIHSQSLPHMAGLKPTAASTLPLVNETSDDLSDEEDSSDEEDEEDDNDEDAEDSQGEAQHHQGVFQILPDALYLEKWERRRSQESLKQNGLHVSTNTQGPQLTPVMPSHDPEDGEFQASPLHLHQSPLSPTPASSAPVVIVRSSSVTSPQGLQSPSLAVALGPNCTSACRHPPNFRHES